MFLLDILLFLAVLSVIIFFHEMGHFLAAKACNVYVDRFSLGMPPRLFGVKLGETDYCLGALPIGGFVKMAGQEDAPLSEEEREEQYGNVPEHRWFNNKPIWQRMIIVLAGPTMNLVLGVLLYGLMAGVGGEVPVSEIDTRIGQVMPDSPAAAAPLYEVASDGQVDFSGEPDAVGWQTGDRIVSVDGRRPRTFSDVVMDAALGYGETLTVMIERGELTGDSRQYAARLEPHKGEEELSRFGISAYEPALVGHVFPGTPAAAAGIQNGDIIRRANGQAVDRFIFTEMLEKLGQPQSIAVQVERDGARVDLTVTVDVVGKIRGINFNPPIRLLHLIPEKQPLEIVAPPRGELAASGVSAGDQVALVNGGEATSERLRELGKGNWGDPVEVVIRSGDTEVAHKLTMSELAYLVTGADPEAQPTVVYIAPDHDTDLKLKDYLVEIDGKPATAALLSQAERDRAGQTISVKARRPAILFGLLRREETVETDLRISKAGWVGVGWDVQTAYYRTPLSQVVPEAFSRAGEAVRRIGRVLVMLVTGSGVGVKDLGGPIMIYDITTKAAHAGVLWLLKITAFVSVNLFVFNLLPLPVLDGGMVVMLAYEGVRGKPLSIKVQEGIQKVGLLLIVGLLLLVTYNDIHRLISNVLL